MFFSFASTCALIILNAERSLVVARLPSFAAPANLFEHLCGGFLVAVFVVPSPPFVRRCLRIALRRVLPFLLTPEGGDVQVIPRVPHLLVTAAVDEVRSEHAVAVAYECVRAMPFVNVEVFVEIVRNRVPGNELPTHSCFQALDILLRRARCEGECGVAGVQMSRVSDLVGHQGAADTRMFGPADHARLKKGAVD